MKAVLMVRSSLDGLRLDALPMPELGSGRACEVAAPAVSRHTGKVCIAI